MTSNATDDIELVAAGYAARIHLQERRSGGPAHREAEPRGVRLRSGKPHRGEIPAGCGKDVPGVHCARRSGFRHTAMTGVSFSAQSKKVPR